MVDSDSYAILADNYHRAVADCEEYEAEVAHLKKQLAHYEYVAKLLPSQILTVLEQYGLKPSLERLQLYSELVNLLEPFREV